MLRLGKCKNMPLYSSLGARPPPDARLSLSADGFGRACARRVLFLIISSRSGLHGRFTPCTQRLCGGTQLLLCVINFSVSFVRRGTRAVARALAFGLSVRVHVNYFVAADHYFGFPQRNEQTKEETIAFPLHDLFGSRRSRRCSRRGRRSHSIRRAFTFFRLAGNLLLT